MAEIKGSQADALKARTMQKEREAKLQEMERIKAKIASESTGLKAMNEMFQSHKNTQSSAERLEAMAAGLVSAEDLKKKRKQDEQRLEQELAAREGALLALKKMKAKERRANMSSLSFDTDDFEPGADGGEEKKSGAGAGAGAAAGAGAGAGKAAKGDGDAAPGLDGAAVKKARKSKDPTVATDFLPDKEREAEEKRLREALEAEWKSEQDKIKKDIIEITYSYWDGSGHRRTIKVTKGTRIDQFLDKCRQDLVDSFHELRGVSMDSLMYIKEDLIIPHHYTFYDLIVTKARGKSGPLFHFDVHDDVRLIGDARVEKDESHAGKVITRGWYERNKHVFPASRWEVFDPSVKRDKYTIHGDEVNKK